MRILGFKLSSVVTSFGAMAIGLLIYKYVLVPFLPEFAKMYGQGATTSVSIFVALVILAYGVLILVSEKNSGT